VSEHNHNTKQSNTRSHPCTERDSNKWSACSSDPEPRGHCSTCFYFPQYWSSVYPKYFAFFCSLSRYM